MVGNPSPDNAFKKYKNAEKCFLVGELQAAAAAAQPVRFQEQPAAHAAAFRQQPAAQPVPVPEQPQPAAARDWQQERAQQAWFREQQEAASRLVILRDVPEAGAWERPRGDGQHGSGRDASWPQARAASAWAPPPPTAKGDPSAGATIPPALPTSQEQPGWAPEESWDPVQHPEAEQVIRDKNQQGIVGSDIWLCCGDVGKFDFTIFLFLSESICS